MKKRTRTLKQIAIELLEKYEASETACIYEYSGDINSATKELDKEIAEYRKEIEQTADKDTNVLNKTAEGKE